MNMDALERRLFLSQSGLEFESAQTAEDGDGELRRLVDATCAGNWSAVLDVAKSAASPPPRPEPDLSRLCVAVASLYRYVGSRWTLPLAKRGGAGEESEHLDTALDALDSLSSSSSLASAPWWHLRATAVRLAVDPDVTQDQLDTHLSRLKKLESELPNFASNLLNAPQAEAVLLLELSSCYHRLGFVSRSRDLLRRARESVGLNFWLDGRMGKRTKFQVDAKAQLVLNVEGGDQGYSSPGDDKDSGLPVDCHVEDDLLLSKIALEGEPVKTKVLTPLEQVIVLSECINLENSEARDELLDERLAPFLDAVLATPQVWCVQYTALFIRSRLEMRKTRRMERAMLQLQSLVDGDADSSRVGKAATEGHVETEDSGRTGGCAFFFSLPMPLFRQVSHVLGDAYMNLGMFKTALEIFQRLGMWKDVIMCHVTVGNGHVAEEIARDLLSKDEASPENWCLLGHATGKVEHYEKAWEVSGSRCAEAKRCVGNILFMRKKYSECLEHYREACRLSSTNFTTWYRLAYAALSVKEWDEAAKAYRHCLNLETDSFECWNNLARCHVELGNKDKAWRCLSECLRFAYDDHNVWQNFMLVSFQTGRVRDVLRSANRLLDLKKTKFDKPGDVAMLESVADLVVDDGSGSVVRREMTTLAARLAAECPQDARFHLMHGRLLVLSADAPSSGTDAETALQRGVQSLVRALGQTKREGTAKLDVLTWTVSVSRLVLDALPKMADAATARRFATSCRLNAHSVAAWATAADGDENDGGDAVRGKVDELRRIAADVEAFCKSAA